MFLRAMYTQYRCFGISLNTSTYSILLPACALIVILIDWAKMCSNPKNRMSQVDARATRTHGLYSPLQILETFSSQTKYCHFIGFYIAIVDEPFDNGSSPYIITLFIYIYKYIYIIIYIYNLYFIYIYT